MLCKEGKTEKEIGKEKHKNNWKVMKEQSNYRDMDKKLIKEIREEIERIWIKIISLKKECAFKNAVYKIEAQDPCSDGAWYT